MLEQMLLVAFAQAQAILEIEQQKKQHQNTVESLLDFLKTSPAWAGDDFEECLEYVNQVRKE
ncbi:hypothetical protein [Cuspidothrix issatschenkoi]|jgi:hypothetical protein|uniref:Uncharacterized protein n=1 Tax=Cuspidothrix issatschenkoi CHARLIE-1 TaxID=2052836 RepID=A0A2S6CX71_9CYAN|nr:hypothetical protein [Cuspidothrix issatschenkoi]PPJ64358.1 hypothetical protein CUN59_05140 [Cuspidothrix issatschenkoi CHARLIE-1]